MSHRSPAVPASHDRSAHPTPPPHPSNPREEAKRQFQKLFAIVSAHMTEYLNSKTPQEYQANFDAIGEPLVCRLCLSLSMAKYVCLQLLFRNQCLAMQNFPGGSWDLEGYDLLRWHGALNRLPRSRRVVTLKSNLTTLENIISVLTANYDPTLHDELEIPTPSVTEDKVSDEVPIPVVQARRASTMPPEVIWVQRSTTIPVPALRSRTRHLANPVVGNFENLPSVS